MCGAPATSETAWRACATAPRAAASPLHDTCPHRRFDLAGPPATAIRATPDQPLSAALPPGLCLGADNPADPETPSGAPGVLEALSSRPPSPPRDPRSGAIGP